MIERLVCDRVREDSMIERYAAGTLPEAEIEALEVHVLECASCWKDLQQALAITAALAPHHQAAQAGHSNRRAVVIRGALAIAASALLAVVVWQVRRPVESERPVRRGAERLAVTTSWQTDGSLRVSWASVPDAVEYKVEFTGGGERPPVMTRKTSIALQAPALGQNIGLVVDVTALAATGDVIARSAPTPVRGP